jgi:hypothetical protein
VKWISMKDFPPTESGEILFIAKDEHTDERIGIAIPDHRYVILRRTDIDFKYIDWWLPIPKPPTSEAS